MIKHKCSIEAQSISANGYAFAFVGDLTDEI